MAALAALAPGAVRSLAGLLLIALAGCSLGLPGRRSAGPAGDPSLQRQDPALSGNGRVLASLVERRQGATVMLQEQPSGRWLPLRREGGERRALLGTGAAVAAALAWADRDDHTDCAVFSLPLWGMATKAQQAEQLAEFDEVITLEDHLNDGGMGSWLLEAASGAGLADRVRLRGLDPVVCGEVGSQNTLNRLGGLSPVLMN